MPKPKVPWALGQFPPQWVASGWERVPGGSGRTRTWDPALGPFPGPAIAGKVRRSGRGSRWPHRSPPSTSDPGNQKPQCFSRPSAAPSPGGVGRSVLACWLETHGQRSLAFLYRLSLSLSWAALSRSHAPPLPGPGSSFVRHWEGQRSWAKR